MTEGENLFLRGISPEEIVKKYESGYYQKLIVKKSPGGHKVEVAPRGMGTDQYAMRYDRQTDRAVFRVCTTNNHAFNFHLKARETETKPDITGLMCHGCHLPLTERLQPSEEPKYLVMKITEKDRVYFIETHPGWFHDTVCAEMRRRELENDTKEGAMYRNAAPAMLLYHRLVTGQSQIPVRPHWSLLKEYGGPLDHDEYFADKLEYRELPNLVYLPTKKQYETKIMDI